MEEIKGLYEAWEGDLIEYKGKILRVVGVDIIKGGHFKMIKAVRCGPLFGFTKVYTIVI